MQWSSVVRNENALTKCRRLIISMELYEKPTFEYLYSNHIIIIIILSKNNNNNFDWFVGAIWRTDR